MIVDINIIEFGVYAFVAYSTFLMLIISIIKDTPATKSQSLIRSIYTIPGIICMILLAGSGTSIFLESTVTQTNNTAIYEVLDNTNAVVTLNSTVTETVSKTGEFVLQNPIWVVLHYMFALVMFAFVITRILQMLMFKD